MYVVNGKKYPCCTSLTMGLIGGKWKTVILYYLIEGKLRYNELRKKMPTVTERSLSLQLQQLQADKLITRKVYATKPPLRVEYSLSPLGETLIPLLQAIADWGDAVVAEHGKELVKTVEEVG